VYVFISRAAQYDGQPFEGTLVIKMYFTRGGVGTFVPALNWALTQARRALQRIPQMQPGPYFAPSCLLFLNNNNNCHHSFPRLTFKL